MNKEMEDKLLPKLRFPEFIESKDWEEKLLEEVAVFLKGRGVSKADIIQTGSQPCIRYGELYTTYNEIIDNVISFTDSIADELILSEPNDVIIPSSGETQNDIATASCVLKGGIALGGDLNILRSKINGVYMAYYLSHNRKKAISKLAQGNAVVHLYSNQLKKLKINYPKTIKEQQKIADCLSSLDDLIAAENEKLDALKNHKKGLMQQLFLAEGKKVPKLRFIEFKDSGDWEGKPIKKIFKILQGFAFSSSDAQNSGVRWLKIADVGIQEMKRTALSYLPIKYKETYKNFLVNKGDYVIALTRPILNKKLKIAQVDEFFDNSLLNQRVGKLISDNNIDFIYFLLQTDKLIAVIEKNIAGNEPPNLSSQQIGNIVSYIPKIDEQEKIANCLLSIDVQLNAQAHKVEDLKTHKKGLMQQLFPTIN